MIENSSDNVKRYSSPGHRNPSLSRRKSGGSEPEKRASSLSRNSSGIPDFGDLGVAAFPNESFSRFTLLPLEGCSNSNALHFINERWFTAMQLCNDPSIDLAVKPVMYSGSSNTSWGHMKLPHQMDFLGELRRQILASKNATIIWDGSSVRATDNI